MTDSFRGFLGSTSPPVRPRRARDGAGGAERRRAARHLHPVATCSTRASPCSAAPAELWALTQALQQLQADHEVQRWDARQGSGAARSCARRWGVFPPVSPPATPLGTLGSVLPALESCTSRASAGPTACSGWRRSWAAPAGRDLLNLTARTWATRAPRRSPPPWAEAPACAQDSRWAHRHRRGRPRAGPGSCPRWSTHLAHPAGNEGLAALVAPPPQVRPTTTGGQRSSSISASAPDRRRRPCRLTSALESGALPALESLMLIGIPAAPRRRPPCGGRLSRLPGAGLQFLTLN